MRFVRMVCLFSGEWVEMANEVCVGLVFENTYSWSTRWNREGVILEVRVYVNSALLYKAITENESPEYNYTSQRTVLEPGPVGLNCATSS